MSKKYCIFLAILLLIAVFSVGCVDETPTATSVPTLSPTLDTSKIGQKTVNPTAITTETSLITKDLKSLALTGEDLPSGWMELEKTLGSNSINKQFLFSVGSVGTVFNYNITKLNSITEAKTKFLKIHEDSSNFDLISKDFGDEAFGYTEGTRTYFIFRYKNIITEIDNDTYPPLKISTLQTLGSLGLRKMTL